MLADKSGRLEDRPKRIAAQALPYDRTADVEVILNELQRGGFIVRYTADGIACIEICAFAKHQSPHVRESESELPGQGTTKAAPQHNLGSAEASPRSPDSGFRIPDSLIPECGAKAPHTLPEKFLEVIKSKRPELDPATVYRKFCDHKPEKQRSLTTWTTWVQNEQAGVTPPSTADPDSKASIEALGMARGMGKWQELTEPWANYKNRVKGQPA